MGATDPLASDLARLLSPERVLSDAAARRAYDCDAYSVERSAPTAIALPISTEEVSAIARYCAAHQIPLTPRGAGTGLSGGALPALGGVVLSTKKLTQILSTDLPNRRLTAQTGIANKKISDAVAHHGLHFAPDPSSQSVSTLGGNIAENSGGPHTLKYGVTAPHILGLTAVLSDGEVIELVADAPGPDFLSLFIGSEGTLGIATEATVRLTPLPKAVETALVAFGEVVGATRAVAAIIADGIVPAALEMMDRGILAALKAAFGLEAPPGTEALLLVECDGDDLRQVRDEMARVEALCRTQGALNVERAENEAARQRLWTARKKGIGAMGRLAPTIVTHDGVIPRSKLPEMLDYVYAVASEHGLGVANLFHAGDGNLHPCFYFDDRIPGMIERVVEAGETIMRRCLELGGSVTGEHGIGVEKLDLMAEMFSPADLEFQGRVRAIFDPSGLCNPCKIIPNQKGCIEHRARWRGAAW